MPKTPSRRNDREVRNIRTVQSGGTPKKPWCSLLVLSALVGWVRGR